MDLVFYLKQFRKRLHWFFLVTTLFAVVGVVVALSIPPTYRAEALLVLESEKIPDELAASTVKTQAIEHLEIIEQRILTRETLIELANRMRVFGPGTDRMAAEAIVADLRRRIGFSVEGGEKRSETATLLTLTFDSASAEQSAAVANEVVTLVLAEDVAMRTSVARQTLEFFEQEVSRLDGDLARVGARILAFKQENRDALPDSLEWRRERLGEAEAELATLDIAEEDVIAKRDRQVRLRETVRRYDDTAWRPSGSREEERLAALRRQRAALPAGDPGIDDFDRRIASLEERIGEGAGSAFRRRMDDLASRGQAIEDRRARLEDEIEALRVSIRATAANAVTLDTLERDEANLRVQYDQAVAAKSLAETGDAIETLSKGQRITVIEQAITPRAPHAPNRVIIALGAIAAGMAVGAVLVAGLALLRRGIQRPADLVTGLGITPYVVLPYMFTEAEVLRQGRNTRFVVTAFVLAIPVALFAVHMLVVPLDLAVAIAARKLQTAPVIGPMLRGA